MENVADALKIAFAIFVFVIALTITIIMFGQLNDVSQVVLASSDQTTYYEYQIFEETSRTVGLETIIPTLYKYYRENYTVLFLDKNGNPLPLYQSQTKVDLWGTGKDAKTGINLAAGTIGKYYHKDNAKNYDTQPVCSFDVEEETLRHEPWTGSSTDFKKNLDAFLQGGEFLYPSGATDAVGNPLKYNYQNSYNHHQGFIKEYKGTQFKELLGEYTYKEEDNTGLQKSKNKRMIIYQKIT